MKVNPVEIEGLKVVELDIWKDNRGFFMERFNLNKFRDANLPTNFVQDNHSRSASKVLRGLHYQPQPAQGKLVGVLRGKIWDVAVDIRRESKTFGRHFSIELSDDNGRLLWVPPGFAHGFCVLGDEPADVLYKVTELYNPKTEAGIRWNDPDFAIQWPISEPIVSERDNKLPSFEYFRNAGS
jgi:dTDP-4-dehydrorhamnose 3,5-epimerase